MQTAAHPRVQWVHLHQQPDGSIVCACNVCHVQAHARSPREVEAFASQHAAHQSSATHYGAGDLVAGVTGALGMKPCSPCEARRLAMNRMLPNLFRRRG